MKLLLATVCICVVVTLSRAGILYKTCPDTKGIGSIVRLGVSSCVNSPCQLVKGKNATIDVTFKSGASDSGLTVKVYGIIAGVKVPFPFPYEDACAGGLSGLNCPLVAGGEYTYTATLHVSKLYPSVKVVVELELINQAGEAEFCLETLVEIVG